jgi:hypothetical protein
MHFSRARANDTPEGPWRPTVRVSRLPFSRYSYRNVTAPDAATVTYIPFLSLTLYIEPFGFRFLSAISVSIRPLL